MSKPKTAFKKVGWRSLKLTVFPKCVVRFGRGGEAKIKFLSELDHARYREVAGPLYEACVADLLNEAKIEWARLKEVGK